MRIIFMGTPKFASVILEKLNSWARVSNSEVVGVFTNADAKSNRGNKLLPSEVKKCAIENDLAVFDPKTLRDEELQQQIRDLKPDVICVAAYAKILPKEVLEIPRYGCINVHASLLPRWRGAAPVERAILAGDEFAGVSIMKMEEGLDTGDFTETRKTPINDKSTQELTLELADLGAGALVDVLGKLDSGANVVWSGQEDYAKVTAITYADKIDKREVLLSPIDGAQAAARKVQASSDSHPAKCIIDGKVVRITRANIACQVVPDIGSRSGGEVVPDIAYAGVLWHKKKLYLKTSDGLLEVLRLKPDGKKEMDALSFVAGAQNVRKNAASWSEV